MYRSLVAAEFKDAELVARFKLIPSDITVDNLPQFFEKNAGFAPYQPAALSASPFHSPTRPPQKTSPAQLRQKVLKQLETNKAKKTFYVNEHPRPDLQNPCQFCDVRSARSPRHVPHRRRLTDS